jgi:hypothetical protein
MRHAVIAFIMSSAFSIAFAQAPVDELQRAQRKAGAAFSDLQKAEFDSKQAQEEHRQAHESHNAAQKHADDLKAQAELAHKKLGAAKTRESAARKTYDGAVEAVDKISQSARKK